MIAIYRERHRDVITGPAGTEETTGNWTTRQIEEFPSMISIEGLSIIVITLNKAVRQFLFKLL